ncbi:MAG: DUF3109 family protein [Candidatus Methylacidiphilales bacterium]
MILLENTIVSEDILEKNFICNLSACKGACCIEGDSGAPITQDELEILEAELENIKPYLTAVSLEAIKTQNFWEKDTDGDLVTTCLPTGECNFSLRDEAGMLKCGIEQAYRDGKASIQKPLSCHLYPIRISNVSEFEALNYHRWDICKPACKLGEEHQVAVYQFLKEPLIRKFGEDWYNELDEIAKQWKAETK